MRTPSGLCGSKPIRQRTGNGQHAAGIRPISGPHPDQALTAVVPGVASMKFGLKSSRLSPGAAHRLAAYQRRSDRMALTPKLPPGRSNRKALAYTAEIRRLRDSGYSFDAIRLTLLELALTCSTASVTAADFGHSGLHCTSDAGRAVPSACVLRRRLPQRQRDRRSVHARPHHEPTSAKDEK